MTARSVAEETLFSLDAPIPKRVMPAESPLRRASGQYVDDDPMAPWHLWALAPLDMERSWQPLAEGTEIVWLTRNQKLRMALVDYRHNKVLAWRRTAGSKPYQPRPQRRS